MVQAKMQFVFPLVLLLTGGCYGAKLLRQPIAVEKTEERVRALGEQQAKLSAEIEELRASLVRQEEMLRALRADTHTRLSELTRNVEAVGSRVDEGFERPDAFYPVREHDESSSPTGEDERAGPETTEGTLTPEQLKEIYDNAYLDLNRGNYQLALLGFRDYLARVPDGPLSDNAQYWIGESYYAQGKYRLAIEEFTRVDRDYPLSDKVPGALLKIATSHVQLGEYPEAREMLRDLVNRFPTSEEATQARAKIQSLD